MNQPPQLVVFVSSNSDVCRQFQHSGVLNSLVTNSIPIKCHVLTLDSAQARTAALEGKKGLRIESVPSGVLLYPDGKMEIFVGATKISHLISGIIQSYRPPQADIPNEPHQQQQRQQHQQQHHQQQHHQQHISTQKSKRYECSDSESDEQDHIKIKHRAKIPKKSSKSRSKPRTKKRHSRGGNDIQFGGEHEQSHQSHQSQADDPLAAYEYHEPRQPTMMSSSMTEEKRVQSNSNILDIAKQMERDRNATLGRIE